MVLPYHLPACLPACLPAYLPTCLPAYLSVCLSVCLSICLSIPTRLYLPICAYLSMPTCLCHLDSIDRSNRLSCSLAGRSNGCRVALATVIWLRRRSSSSGDGHLAPATVVQL